MAALISIRLAGIHSAACLLLLSGLACSEGGASDASKEEEETIVSCPELDLGLPAELQMDALNPEQAVQYCRAFREAFVCTYPEEFICQRAGLYLGLDSSAEEAEAVCSELEVTCLEENQAEEEYPDCDFAEPLTNCSATVAEFENCWQDLFSIDADFAREVSFTCSELDAFSQWVETVDTDFPESCLPLSVACYL